MQINEVIVVEGKADTAKIKQAVTADVIETNGSALNLATRGAIVRAAQTRGIIIFTDPDYNGERLRKIITTLVPDAKHAFLTKDAAGAKIKHHSLGIEYANIETIQSVLQAVSDEKKSIVHSDIQRSDLLAWGLINGPKSAKLRTQLAEALNLGYVNGKQLLKRLQMFGIQKGTVEQMLTTLEVDE